MGKKRNSKKLNLKFLPFGSDRLSVYIGSEWVGEIIYLKDECVDYVVKDFIDNTIKLFPSLDEAKEYWSNKLNINK